MNRRRLLAALFFSAVVVVTLVAIVYAERADTAHTLRVWVLTRDVTAGAQYSADDVTPIQVSAGGATINYESRDPGSVQARYARSLHAHDVLRSDDLSAAPAVAEVSLTLANPPPLNVGDSIDVFVMLSSGRQVSIGRALSVVTVAGGSVDVLVPARDEAAWVAVASSSTTLRAARVSAGSLSDPAPLSPDEAIGILCGPACAGAGSGSPPAAP